MGWILSFYIKIEIHDGDEQGEPENMNFAFYISGNSTRLKKFLEQMYYKAEY